MIVKHNMLAMNSNRMLGIISNSIEKTTEKLSSGYKINRSADDAAGLAISEKMRRQIRGLTQASYNAQDGISLVQVADGALNEVHDMLQRMNELSVKSANGTNTDSDREAIQQEIRALIDEIDRIGTSTQFNEKYIFGGGEQTSGSGGVGGSGPSGSITSQDAIYALQSAVGSLGGSITGQGSGTITMEMNDTAAKGTSLTIGSKNYIIGSTTSTDSFLTPAVLGTDYSVSTVSVSYTTAYTETATNESGITASAQFTVEPTTEAEKEAQNQFLNGINTSNLKTAANASQCSFTGSYSDGVYSVNLNKYIGWGGVEHFNIKKGDSVVGQISVAYDQIGSANTAYTLKVGTIHNATISAGGTENHLTASNDLYDASGNLYLLNGGTKNLGSTDPSTLDLRIKTTIPGMTDANGDGVDDNNSRVITSDKAYDLIENLLPSGFTKNTSGGKVTYTFAETPGSGGSGSSGIAGNDDLSLYLQVGAEAGQGITIELEKMNSNVIGVCGVDVRTQASATTSIDSIKRALEKVSGMRSKYGAYQNRLEHTINNLNNVVENTTSAESAIRDTDMAKSMVEFSKLQILQQFGQSVLAQANQNSGSVLSLIQ